MNSFISWDDKFNTGNFVIDYQHQRLVRLINDLDEVSRHEELKTSLLSIILDEVEKYTQYHFQTEESIMEKVNYSNIEDHKHLHQEFIWQLEQFKNDYERGHKHIDKVFCEYLKDWLLNHIANEDPKFICELSQGQGVV